MIREFAPGDEKSIAALETECFSSPWSRAAILQSRNNGTAFIVFEENGKVLGYAGLQMVLDEGYVTNIAVTKSARERGIGKSLVGALISLAKDKGLAFISLEVRESNTPAISLYTKCGFKDFGKRKNFYQNPTEDAVIMTKEF